MSRLMASEGDSKPKQLPPAGTHVARCFSVIDIGTQSDDFGERHKIRVTWELPDELAVFSEDKGEQPFVISKDYTLSLYEKANLRHDLEGWRGKQFTADELKGFDIFTLIGVPCLLTVIHKASKNGDKTYANVNGISRLAKGMNCLEQINPTVSYAITDGENSVFRQLPEWLRKKIEQAQEWGQEQPSTPDEVDDDEIPF